MNIKAVVASLLTVGLLAGCAWGKHEHHHDQAKLQAQAPNGTVKEAELEKEHGKLVWSFDIATPGTTEITEVNVDAITGAVAAVEKETPEKEAKEKKGD